MNNNKVEISNKIQQQEYKNNMMQYYIMIKKQIKIIKIIIRKIKIRKILLIQIEIDLVIKNQVLINLDLYLQEILQECYLQILILKIFNDF